MENQDPWIDYEVNPHHADCAADDADAQPCKQCDEEPKRSLPSPMQRVPYPVNGVQNL